MTASQFPKDVQIAWHLWMEVAVALQKVDNDYATVGLDGIVIVSLHGCKQLWYAPQEELFDFPIDGFWLKVGW